MKTVCFFVAAGSAENPRAQSRPRTTAAEFDTLPGGVRVQTKKSHTFSSESKALKQWRANVHAEAMRHRQSPLWDGPFRVRMVFLFRRPAYHLGKTDLTKAGREQPFPYAQGDVIDNLPKCVADECEGVIFDDDAHCISARSEKYWLPVADFMEPGVVVVLQALDEGWWATFRKGLEGWIRALNITPGG